MSAFTTDETMPTIYLDGESLMPEDLVNLSTGNYRLDLTEEAWENIRAGRVVIDTIVASGEVVYGTCSPFAVKCNRLNQNCRNQHWVWTFFHC